MSTLLYYHTHEIITPNIRANCAIRVIFTGGTNSTIGKALKYNINQEKYLRVFLTDGNVPPDNNPAEQTILPFTIGRKNFVLIATDNGAKASAMLYSLAETAKANEFNTYKYFELLLTEIPKHMEDNDLSFIDDLLPWSPRVQKECLSKFKKS